MRRHFLQAAFLLASAQAILAAEPSAIPAITVKPSKSAEVIPVGLSQTNSTPGNFVQRLSRLKDEHDTLLRERGEIIHELHGLRVPSNDRAQIHTQIEELIGRMAAVPPRPALTKPVINGLRPDRIPSDPLGLARVLYIANDHEGVIRTLRMADFEMLDRADRAFARYMIASSLRMQGKRSEAAAMYREVVDGHEDDFVSECALWQIQSMRFQHESQSQLEDSAKRRESK